jgi:GR25 family glycosyltransferase involved in LPS biosynthesis
MNVRDITISNKESIKAIAEKCKISTAHGDIVLFTNGNGWYINTLIKNLITSMKLHDADYYNNLIVFCSDQDGYQRCKEEQFENYELVTIPLLNVDSFTSNNSNDIDIYTRLCFVKVALMSYLLELGYIGLYIDPDMAFTDKAIDDLISYLKAPANIFYAGREEYINSNIMICRPCDIVKKLYSLTTDDVDYIIKTDGFYGDEDLFRSRIPSMNGIKLVCVNETNYPNGKDLPRVRSHCKMAHANYVVGLQNKIKLLTDNSCWFIAEPTLTFNLKATIIEPTFTLALNMIVKNESHVIVKTLSVLMEKLPITYWVISDTGSTDGTQDIIKRFFLDRCIPGELIEHPWRDFGWNRTQALEAAYNKTDYLLIFDADDDIHGTIMLPDLKVEGWAMVNFNFGPGLIYQRPLLINNRLKFRFVGVLHEYLECLSDKHKKTLTIHGDYYIVSGKTGDRSRDPLRFDKDAAILEKGFHDEKDQGLRNRYAFYCAQSYKDGNRTEKSIEWYKRVLTLGNWDQEKYYACLMIAGQTTQLNEKILYYNEAHKYDIERREHIVRLMDIYYQLKQNLLVNALYHKIKHDARGKPSSDKLFLTEGDYKHQIELYNSLCAYYMKDYSTGYECCKRIILAKPVLVSPEHFILTIRNLVFYQSEIGKDTSTDLLNLFHTVNHTYTINPADKEVLQVWKILYEHCKLQLSAFTTYKPAKDNFKPKIKVMLTMTTCKRYDLFEKTINSIINQWTDIDMVDYWYCVDDNSSQTDCLRMKQKYPFFDFYFKGESEKGHLLSMNLIWSKLQEIKPTYWVHLEDDFLFFDKMDYITQAIKGLDLLKKYNVKQILFNRSYAETIDDYSTMSHRAIPETDQFCLHDYKPGQEFTYPNCHYWPNYSFRPSLIDVQTIMTLGNYALDTVFNRRVVPEAEYAKKWTDAGYASAFFNKITCLHTGKLTSEKGGGPPNAYDLNGLDKLKKNPETKGPHPEAFKTFVVNLERRPDRLKTISDALSKINIPFEVFTAVDGQQLKPTLELYKLFARNDFGNRKGVIGCALSHLKLWNKLLEDKSTDVYLIMEDDVTFKPDISIYLKDLAALGLDVIILGYSMFEKDKSKFKDDIKVSVRPLTAPLYIGGTFCYMINKNGAKSLVNYINANGIKHGIDYLMKISQSAALYEVSPQLAFSEWNEGGKSIDTDIQNTFDGLDFKDVCEHYPSKGQVEASSLARDILHGDDLYYKPAEGKVKYEVSDNTFIFVQGMDIHGDDLYHKPTDAQTMKKLALTDHNVKSYNTLGFFKSTCCYTDLKPSPYFGKLDGIYIKKITVKILCCWATSDEIYKHWNRFTKGNYTWNNIQLTGNHTADYYVILNFPQHQSDYYYPKKTMVYQMEPWASVKSWGEWAEPDPAKFMAVFPHKTSLNLAEWQLEQDYLTLQTMDMAPYKTSNEVASICSSKYFCPGHKYRIDFIKFIESKDQDKGLKLKVYGETNSFNFKSYVGQLPMREKSKGILPYKYYFMCENNAEHNYITEKLWECIVCETLCFYWGCTNVEEWVDPRAYVKLDMNDFEGSYQIILQAIRENWYEQRLPYIKAEKVKVLNTYSFMPTIERAINNNLRSK